MNTNSVINKVSAIGISLLIVILTGLSGCDNSLDPLDRDKGIYSIYGYLEIGDEINYIRVKNLNIPLLSDTTGVFEGTVSLTNVNNGNSWALRDTVVIFDSLKTHNFIIDQLINPSTTYRINAERPDGKSVSATTTTPNIAQATAQPKEQNCFTPITFSFEPVNDETLVQMQINFELYDENYSVSRILRSFAPGSRLAVTMTPFEIISEAYCANNPNCSTPHCIDLTSEFLTVNYIHYGPDFEYGGESNVSDSLSVPGGAGQFIGLLKNSYKVKIDTSLETLTSGQEEINDKR